MPGTDDGRCRCRQQLRNSFLNLKVLQEKTALLPGIRKYNAAFLQCAAAKFDALRTDFLHFFKNSSQPTADLSVRTVPETRQPSFSDSVRPAANGRLPESGSQCPVKRTFPYEKEGILDFHKNEFVLKNEML